MDILRRFTRVLILTLLFLSPVLRGQIPSKSGVVDSIPSDKFHFAILGDRTGSGPDSWKHFDAAVAEINRLRPDFVIFIGDLIEGYTESPAELKAQWKEALPHLNALDVPYFAVPGNHDIFDNASYHAWQDVFGFQESAFSHQGCRFLLLNSEIRHHTGEEGLSQTQVDMAKMDMRHHGGASHYFVFMHRPLWIEKGKAGNEWNRIEEQLAGRASSVFAGHLHLLGAKKSGKSRWVIVGPTGGEMRFPRNPALGFFHHFTWVSVEVDTVHITFIESGRVYSESVAIKAYQRALLGRTFLKN